MTKGRIESVYWDYAYSYKSGELTEDMLSSPGVTSVVGKDLDQDTSNGSGKSSVPKIIFYALFGQELYGESIDTISNRKFNKGHYVEIKLRLKGRSIRIERARGFVPPAGDERYKNLRAGVKNTCVRLSIDGVPFGNEKANGESISSSEIEKMIRSLLPITPELFLASVLTAQNSKSNFLLAADTEKKELLSELLGLFLYEGAFEIVKKEISATESQVEDAESRIEEINSNIEDKVKELVKLGDQAKRFKEGVDTDIRQIRSKFLSLEQEYKELRKDKPRTLNEKEIKSRLEEKQLELNKLSETNLINESEEVKLLDEQISECHQTLRMVETETAKLSAKADATEVLPEEELSILKDSLDGLIESVGDLKYKSKDELEQGVAKVSAEIRNAHSAMAVFKTKIEGLEREKTDLLSSEKCPTCERPWEEEHLQHRREKSDKIDQQTKGLKRELEKAKAIAESAEPKRLELALKYKQIEQKLNEDEEARINLEATKLLKESLIEKATKIKGLLDRIEEKKRQLLEGARKSAASSNEKLSALNREIQELNDYLSKAKLAEQALKNWEQSLKTLESRMQELTIQAEETKTRTNPYEELIEETKQKIQALEERKKTNSERITKLQDELRYLNFWKNGFGPTGIRSFISDEVLAELNSETQVHLDYTSESSIQAVFSPESVSQKGAVQNKISTKYYINGKESPMGLLSGGELQRIAVAVNLAIATVAERRSGLSLGIKFMDEPFDGIDSNGQLKVVNGINRWAQDTKVFLVSHDINVQSLTQSGLYVVKKDEVSRIVSKEEFHKAT